MINDTDLMSAPTGREADGTGGTKKVILKFKISTLMKRLLDIIS